MTKTEAIAAVQAVGRHCRGPYRTEDEIAGMPPIPRRTLQEAIAYAHGLGAPAGLGLRELVTWLLRQGMLEAAERLDSLARRPCGADLNPLIIEAGFDGEEHHICCPQCQLEISYHAPWWPDLEEG